MFGSCRRRSGTPSAVQHAKALKMARIDRRLIEIMECPVAHAPLVQVDDWLYSTDSETRRKYRIEDGIPVMLVEDSIVVEPAEFERAMAEADQRQCPEAG